MASNMKRSLAYRSGKMYPHNAICEILKKGTPSYTPPTRYSHRVVNKFFEILERGPEKTRKAYMLVFSCGNSLTDAAKVLKVSPTTVRRWLENIYFVRDEYGYQVAELAKYAMSNSFTETYKKADPSLDTIEKWHWWIDKHAAQNNPNLTKDQMICILDAVYRDLDYTIIADFYKLNRMDVMEFVNQYKDWKHLK